MSKTQTKLDDFTKAYIACALWSSTDGNGNSLDDDYGQGDIAQATLEEMVRDCAAFQESCADLLNAYYQTRSAGDAGQDFWLTRNGHGAGFWDRGLGQLGRQLTDQAKVYGSSDLYVGDDQQVWSA